MRIQTKLPKEAISRQLEVLFGMDPRPLVDHWYKIYQHGLNHEGNTNTCAYLKALYTQSIQIALHQTIHPIPFRKSNKKGHAKDLRPFISYLKGDENQIRLAFTVLRLYSLIRSDPRPELDSIQARPSKDWKAPQYKEFSDFAHKWVIPENPSGKIQVVPRARSGPNGPSSLLYSHLDAVALSNRPYLLRSLDRLAEIVDPSFGSLREWVVSLSDWVKSNPIPLEGSMLCGRLSALAEGGCKTRTIAIGDLFSQAVLLPLHKKLMQKLASLSQDGTMNQEESIALVSRWTLEGPLFSFDLSQATDRFPRRLTEITISALFGKEVAYLWGKVMSEDRDFSLKSRSLNLSGIYYTRGQPMGLYSSWPAFAFSHHVFIRYCAFKEGKTTFNKYTVIGDDVVIADTAVANRYEKEMTSLGVSISQSKSLLSYEPPYAAEVCKRLVLNGIDVSPVPSDLMMAVWLDELILPNYLQEITNRYGLAFSSSPRPWSDFVRMYSRTPKQNRAVKLLTHPGSSIPINQSVNGKTSKLEESLSKESNPWIKVMELNGWDLDGLNHYVPLVGKRLRKVALARKLEEIIRGWNQIYAEEILIPNSLVPVPVPDRHDDKKYHPLWEGRKYVQALLTKIKVSPESMLMDLDYSFDQLLEDLVLSYTCDPNLRDYRSRPRRAARIASRLMLETYRVLQGEIPLPREPKSWF